MNTIHEDGPGSGGGNGTSDEADFENNNTLMCKKLSESGDEARHVTVTVPGETTSCYDSSEPESGIGSSRQNLEDDKTTTDDEERLKLQRTTTAAAPSAVTTINEKRPPTTGFRDERAPQNKQGGRQTTRLVEGLPRSSSEARIRAPNLGKGPGTGTGAPGGRGPIRKPDFFAQGTVSPLTKHRMQHKRQVTSADLYNKKIPGGTLSRQGTSDSLFTMSAGSLSGDSASLLRKDSKQNLYQKHQQSDGKLGNKKYMLGSSSTGSELSLQAKMLPYPSQMSIPFSSGQFSGSRNDNRGSQFSLAGYPFRNCGDCEPNNLSMYSQSSSHLDDEQRGEDSQGLTWRRLHMSRAKLKATATTSELLSGFAMIAMVELQINEPTNVPEWLFIMFSICTTILVAVHIFALMISTYLLPNIDAISKLQSTKLVKESPHERMRGFVELAWTFSTVFGLFLFLVEVAILCWVKFWDHSINAAIAATIIVIPVLVIFVIFVFYFYHNLVAFKFKASVSDVKELEAMKKKLDDASVV